VRQHDHGLGDDPVHNAKKTCLSCSEVTELLRFRCPRCSSEMFDASRPGLADPGLIDVMQGRQRISQQHTDHGSRLFMQGLADEALQEFEKAIEANPWNATAHGNIGVILLRRGEPQEALKRFERALESDPHVAGAREMVEKVRDQLH
jgi:tetratricopeptide (TPR) repeat protein